MSDTNAFIRAAVIPRERNHTDGTLDAAAAILALDPSIATANLHTAATLGDADTVAALVSADSASAVEKGGPYDWDALTHLCFSRYLRLDSTRSASFARCAEILLAAGASANSGFFEGEHQPEPEWESVLYGAAGVAHSPDVTRVLLDHGANPNDNEVPYHTPETYDNRCMQLLVENGRMTAENLSLMLIRKIDWHDHDGVVWLLDHGTDPAHERWRGVSPLHHALSRNNRIETIAKLLDHGADPLVADKSGFNAVVAAARTGRGDALKMFADRGTDITLRGADTLIAACAIADEQRARVAAAEPQLVQEMIEHGGRLLARFALSGNGEGVRLLLDLGVPVDARYAQGDGYWGLAADSTALHVAAWLARHRIVQLLIDRGADVDAKNVGDVTPLMYAVKACVDSYWADRRSPESVDALLRAGASREGIPLPTGFDAIDQLLQASPP